MNPLVSVIVPTCNRPSMLRECLQSIAQQTYGNIEIVVVNDGGESVREMVSSLELGGKVQFIDHEVRKGPAAARNSGIKAAKGKYIAYLDDDDVYYPDHIEVLVHFLEIHRSHIAYSDAIKAIQCKVDGGYQTEKPAQRYSHEFDAGGLLVSNYIPIICVLHRRDCIGKTGYFDESLFTHEDWDLLIRFSVLYEFGHISKITCEYRWRYDDSSATIRIRGDFIKTTRKIYRKYKQFPRSFRVSLKQKDFIARQFISLLVWKLLIIVENVTMVKLISIRKRFL